MSNLTLYQGFLERKKISLLDPTLAFALTRRAPDIERDLTLEDIDEILAGGGYRAGGFYFNAKVGGTVSAISSVLHLRAGTLTVEPVRWGDTIQPFRFVVLYAPKDGNRLWGFWDCEKEVHLSRPPAHDGYSSFRLEFNNEPFLDVEML